MRTGGKGLALIGGGGMGAFVGCGVGALVAVIWGVVSSTQQPVDWMHGSIDDWMRGSIELMRTILRVISFTIGGGLIGLVAGLALASKAIEPTPPGPGSDTSRDDGHGLAPADPDWPKKDSFPEI